MLYTRSNIGSYALMASTSKLFHLLLHSMFSAKLAFCTGIEPRIEEKLAGIQKFVPSLHDR